MTTKIKIAPALLGLTLLFSASARSQDAQTTGNAAYRKSPEHYFQLTFRVLDISSSGKIVDAKSYKEILASGPKSANTSSIRSSDRVPVITGGTAQSIASSLVNTQYQYIDVGTNIDANLAAVVNDSLRLHVTARVSSMSTAAPGSAKIPIIRQTSWDSNVTVPIGKPTVIFSSDNSADKGRTELELTAREISNH
jgi:hypothetical protein